MIIDNFHYNVILWTLLKLTFAWFVIILSNTIVHYSDGSGRTGTYCLIDLVLNRIVNGKLLYYRILIC